MVAHAADAGNDGVLEAGFFLMLLQLVCISRCAGEFQRIHADHIRLGFLK